MKRESDTQGAAVTRATHLGLTSEEADRIRAASGPNEIARATSNSPWILLARQFASPVVWLLLGACVLSGLLGELADAVAIGTIVALNGVVGFLQENKAEHAILALRALTAPRARVVRDGVPLVVSAADIVVGDLLLLEAGDIVAADARLLDANSLSTNEAALTGESGSIRKAAIASSPDAPLAERTDRVFMGTSVSAGTGRALVESTGMATELGKIAHLLTTTEESGTPLEARLQRVSRTLLGVCLAIVAITGIAGLARHVPPFEVFLASVSTAVAAVPEGLPAVVTIALAIGVQRMAARHVLVRHLPAVETLGCATVICTDKTGTLTTGTMRVRELWGPDHTAILDAAAACSDAELTGDETSGVGDTTEIALLLAAAERGIQRAEIELRRPRVGVRPFDSERKRMSIFREDGVLYVKGAVEVVLSRCTSGTEGAEAANSDMASRGLRVLAIAVGERDDESSLRLLGLAGIADPPRSEAIEAVKQAHGAGIITVMITGDHPATARAIARELGLARPGESLEDRVHARATPEQKLAIVKKWSDRGAVVAMTGDGVNDAPALRQAHVGIAMGKTGTEVTREAADVVLADDNFASILAAVREGRGIFDNIRKTLVYLLAGNTAELLLMLIAAVAGLPFPLLPLHLLWVNLATDGLPALALVMDPADDDVLSRPPRDPKEPILGRAEWRSILVTGVLQAGVTLGAYLWALSERNLDEARNLAFSTLVFGEVLRAFAARSVTKTFFGVGAFTNVRLVAIALASVVVQIAIHHIPETQTFFHIGTLSMADCVLSFALGLIPVTVIEVAKLVRSVRARALQT